MSELIDKEIQQVNKEVLALGDLTKVDPKILDEVQDKIKTLLERSAHSHNQHITTMRWYNAGWRNQTLQ